MKAKTKAVLDEKLEDLQIRAYECQLLADDHGRQEKVFYIQKDFWGAERNANNVKALVDLVEQLAIASEFSCAFLLVREAALLLEDARLEAFWTRAFALKTRVLIEASDKQDQLLSKFPELEVLSLSEIAQILSVAELVSIA